MEERPQNIVSYQHDIHTSRGITYPRPDSMTAMRHLLNIHPDSHGPEAAQIEVEIARSGGDRWLLSYVVTGTIGDIRLPPITDAARRDELWRHTCFEAFVRSRSNAAYYEFNFAPSTQWAAYGFTGYRSGMSPTEISTPAINVEADAGRFVLTAVLNPRELPGLSSGFPLQVGLSAVIEDQRGDKSYWALAHPPGKPDFHHSDGFAIELP